MIKIIIFDMENTKDVFSIAELREVLSTRYENNANSFEIEPLKNKDSHLTVIIKDIFGVINYFDSTKDENFVSDNPDNSLDRDGFTTLYYENAKVGEEFMNRQIVSASDAMRAAEEFAVTMALPTAVQWIEL